MTTKLIKKRALAGLGATIGIAVLENLFRMVRYRAMDEQSWDLAIHPTMKVIYAFWHGRLLVPIHTHRNRGIGIMISKSRDGDVVARVASAFGFDPIRGSTSRGASEAVERMVEIARDGRNIAITPDGPRGPRHVFQIGAVYLARWTGLPLVLGSMGCTNCWHVRAGGWDRMIIPKPGSTVYFKFEGPFQVPAKASKTVMEHLRRTFEETRSRLTRETEAEAARHPKRWFDF